MFCLDKVEICSFLSSRWEYKWSTNEGETNMLERVLGWGSRRGQEVRDGPEGCVLFILVNSHTDQPSHSSLDTIQQWWHWQISEPWLMWIALCWPRKWAVTSDLKKWMPQAYIQVQESFFILLISLQISMHLVYVYPSTRKWGKYEF